MNGGRPLRFLTLTLGGWVAIRTLALLPTTAPLPALVNAIVPLAVAQMRASPPARPVERVSPPIAAVDPPPRATASLATPDSSVPTHPKNAPDPVGGPPTQAEATLPPPLVPAPFARGPGRLAGSIWLLARGGPAGSLDGGQLGASQAGVRVTYALGRARQVALAARVSAPMRGSGREVALGLEWQPTQLPVRLIAEQRISLDGGRGGPTIGIIGGYGPADIADGVRLEAYGQAGAIARDGVETFIDTAARVTHPVHVGGKRLDLGLGAWGSAQRGARRFDVGPTLGVAVPVAGKAIRLNLDWRQRLGGDARPGSGLAFSIGSDF